MTVFLIILAAVLGLGVLVLSAKLKLETSYTDCVFKIRVSALNITLFDNTKIKKPQTVIDEKKEEKDKTDLLGYFIGNKNELAKDLREILRFARSKIHAKDFLINLTFGLKDAADTGIFCGGIWAFIGTVFPVLDSSIKFDEIPTINVNPVFNKVEFLLEYKGTYTLRVTHILILAIKLLFKYKKYKGGVSNGSTASN